MGLPDGRWWRFLYCSLLNVISLVVCLIGAGMFAKTSVMVLGIVCISLLSVIISFCIQSPMKVSLDCMIPGIRCDKACNVYRSRSSWLCHIVLLQKDMNVSEDLAASIFRVRMEAATLHTITTWKTLTCIFSAM